MRNFLKKISEKADRILTGGAGEYIGKKAAEAASGAVERRYGDPDSLRYRFNRIMLRLESPDGDNIRKWRNQCRLKIKQGDKWIRNPERLLIDGRPISENRFNDLLAGFKCTDDELESLLRVIDKLDNEKFCEFMGGILNDNIRQDWDSFIIWLGDKGGTVGKKILTGLGYAGIGTAAVIGATGVVVAKGARVTKNAISDAANAVARKIQEADNNIDPNYYD